MRCPNELTRNAAPEEESQPRETAGCRKRRSALRLQQRTDVDNTGGLMSGRTPESLKHRLGARPAADALL